MCIRDSKNELNIMMLMPLIIMVTLSGMGSMSIVQNTPCLLYTSLYDYVEGTDVIDTLKEPVEEDYQITQDKYEMLDEYSTLEDYEAIYTSCTKESMFTPDGENLEDQPEAEFQAFVKKYKKADSRCL